MEGYRTSLTGMTEGELRALFMLSIPTPLAELGLSQELRAALLKLSASLPVWKSEHEKAVRQRFYLDSTWWHQGEMPVPYLQTIYQVVWQDLKLNISYLLVPGVEISQDVSPYGLVAKAGVWYLVYERKSKLHAQRVSKLLGAQPLDETFERPEDFDLTAFWKDWCNRQEQRQALYPVRVRAAPDLISLMLIHSGEGVNSKIDPDESKESGKWINFELTFESLESARTRLLAYGGDIEVLEPRALRLSMRDFAQQIAARYAGEE